MKENCSIITEAPSILETDQSENEAKTEKKGNSSINFLHSNLSIF